MSDNPNRPEKPSPRGLEGPSLEIRPSPEMQKHLDEFRAQKEAKQDSGEIVDHRRDKALNDADEAAGRQRGETAAAQRNRADG